MGVRILIRSLCLVNANRIDAPRSSSSRFASSHSATAVALFLVLVAVGRIVSTYHAFSQAYDEPAHIACGMEWLDKGTFTLEPQPPPLPRNPGRLGPLLSRFLLPAIKFASRTISHGLYFST